MSARTAALPVCLVAAMAFAVSSAMAADPPAKPQRQWTIYLLPHSHVDIGYTHVQPEVVKKQWENIDKALELCRKTADYPAGARFKWNTEVLWAVDSYLTEQPPEKQQRLIDAIRSGQVELQALYGNELTGLCRPEELMRLCECSQRLAKRCGVKIRSAMISDVPGYVWGTVPALAQAGVKYFSIGPNFCDRMGATLAEWADKPFYWVGPDGQDKVLCYVPYLGYALGHTKYQLDPKVMELVANLEKKGYPYDIMQLRWNVGGDNGPPDEKLPEIVKNWNAKNPRVKMVIATATEAFEAFEKQYGAKLPSYSGDWTPYWEDGAYSSARETGLNRTAAERLVQAEALWTMLDPAHYPAAKFAAAWRNVILYDEHTWGAFNSISEPDKPFVKNQWKIKQAFALDADKQSRELLDGTQASRPAPQQHPAVARADVPLTLVDVFNTSCWPRTELVVVSSDLFGDIANGVVVGPDGKPMPTQHLSTGDVAFLAKDIPAFAGRRYSLSFNATEPSGKATVKETLLRTPSLSVRVDPATGGISSLYGTPPLDAELCKSRIGLNRYYYVRDVKPEKAQQAGPAKVTVKESGPLVASLLVESEAPGCTKLTREVRVVDGLDRVDLIDTLDKKPVRKKESVFLGFDFNVPNGQVRMDVPWSVVRPEVDQLPAACKNWFSVGRWVDVSNKDYGVTWATLDASLIELGAISPDTAEPGNHMDRWLSRVPSGNTIYSYIMNNHWHTNYRADQEGPTTFRYAIRPHKEYDAVATQRFGIECSQPLVVLPARGEAPSGKSLLTVDTPDVIVASLKPSADGKAYIVRLFGAAGRAAKVNLHWATPPKAVYRSNLAEEPVEQLSGPIAVSGYGVVTIRAEL
ncbi:MAG: glycosyl hydrolase-related protein [Thermoguttaceae bacterium]